MPCWYYDKNELKKTLSIQDGIDYETECRYRKEGARLIINIGTAMELGYTTVATGVVFFHRFYMFHSFLNFPRYVTACCCLFFAGKVEETPKKCNDIIKTARDLLSEQDFQTLGNDPKEEVLKLEKVLLQTIKFDFEVEHPYHYVVKYAKYLKGDKEKLEKVVQMAWTFVNDSLCTNLCLQWEPEIIAVAFLYLAGKFCKFEVVDWSGRTRKHKYWWDKFMKDISIPLLQDICHQLLDLYKGLPTANSADSTPLEARISAMEGEDTFQPVSPAIPQLSVATDIPVEVGKSESKAAITPSVELLGEKAGTSMESEISHQYSSLSANLSSACSLGLTTMPAPHPPITDFGCASASYPYPSCSSHSPAPPLSTYYSNPFGSDKLTSRHHDKIKRETQEE